MSRSIFKNFSDHAAPGTGAINAITTSKNNLIERIQVTIGNVTLGAGGYLDIRSYLPSAPSGKSLRFCTVRYFGDCTTPIFILDTGEFIGGIPNGTITNLNVSYWYW